MFFRSSNTDKNVNNAYWITFLFWGGVLLINSITELFYSKRLVSSSFITLIMGLLLFFIVVFISNVKKQKHSD
ncbi:hypothetical protein J32TS2_08850 [Shouchella clausii]|jgi:glycerol uptake facilitator-like aquaporin|nr:hypothetical protein J32TS2_08850 [Shouchella clausii]